MHEFMLFLSFVRSIGKLLIPSKQNVPRSKYGRGFGVDEKVLAILLKLWYNDDSKFTVKGEKRSDPE